MWSVGATRAADTMVGGAGALKKGGEGGNYRYFLTYIGISIYSAYNFRAPLFSSLHIPAFVPVFGVPESRAGFLFRPDSGNPATTSLMFLLFYGPEPYIRSGPESVLV